MKTNTIKLFVLAGLSTVIFASCSSDTNAEIKKETKETIDETKDLFKEQKAELKKSLESTRKDIDEQLETINNHLADAGDDVKEEWNESIHELEELGNDIDDRLDKLDKNDSRWEQFKEETSEWMSEAGNKIKDVSNDFAEWLKGEE